jgi:TolB-like protein
LPFDQENLGEQTLKGFDELVKVYAVSLKPGGVMPKPEALAQHDPAATELPDKPSIAVLPFDNMSGDKEQEYFSDGITEDIITELSRFPFLFVIARHSSFAFKGKSIDIKEVGHQLGVEYVVEGSVRKAGNRVRISSQLIEVETGNHIWAERYDRELEDIFAVQDEVARAIVAVLPGRIEKAVAERGQRKPTDNIKAYEFVLRGKMYFNRLNADDLVEAHRLFEKAVELDPWYARAHAFLALTYLADALFGWATDDFSQEAIESAQKAAALDSNDILCESVLGYAYLVRGLWEDAEKQFNKVIAQNVNDAEIMAWNGDALNMLGRHEEGRDLILEAMRLDPLHPPLYDWFFGCVLYSEKHYEEVIQVLTGRVLLNSLAYAVLAGAYAYLGRVEEARRALDTFIRERRRELSTANIHVEVDTIGTLAEAYRDHYRLEADWEHFSNGLRKAGLPE